MKIYKTQTMDEMELPDAPMFYKSASGGPYVSRLGGGIDVKKNMFNILETVDIKGVIKPADGTYTYYHELGYTPFVIGSYIMRNATTSVGTEFPSEISGLIPENRHAKYGAALEHMIFISYADSSIIKITLPLDPETAIFDFRLHFLREKGLDEDS